MMAEARTTEIIAYKGFDKNLACRGYQYEAGKTFEHIGDVKACSSGFHACENPFDVLSYYPLVDSEGASSRFAKVTMDGEISRHDSDSKIASARITIDAELKLPDFIIAGVNWLIEATKVAISASGSGQTTDKGEDGAQIGSSGNDARIGSSGYGAQIGSSGNGARIGSSGYGAQIGSSGNGAQIGSSGNGARIDSSGDRAVIASSGVNARVKGTHGAWLSVAEYVWNEIDARYDCIGFATGQAGFDNIPADTWLIARDGKLTAA